MKINLSDEMGQLDIAPYLHPESLPLEEEHIKRLVRRRIAALPQPSKRRHRFRMGQVIAAMLAVCAIVLAVPALTDSFEGWRNSRSSSGLVRFESSVPYLEGRLLGTACDGNTLLAAIELTMTNGSTFADNGYTNLRDGRCTNGDTEDTSAHCALRTVSDSGTPLPAEPTDTCYVPQYTLSDDRKTLTMLVGLRTDSLLPDSRLILTNHYYTAYRVVNTLTAFEQNDRSAADEVLTIARSNRLNLESTNIAYNGMLWELQQIESKDYALPFVTELSINTASQNNLNIPLTDAAAVCLYPEMAEETTVTVSPLSLSVSIQYPIDPSQSEDALRREQEMGESNWRMPDSSRSRVILSDGMVYYLCPVTDSRTPIITGEEKTSCRLLKEFRFSDVPDPQNLSRFISLDPNRIEQILFNGIIIYQKQKG